MGRINVLGIEIFERWGESVGRGGMGRKTRATRGVESRGTGVSALQHVEYRQLLWWDGMT